MLYLTLTGRNDWDSKLAFSNNKSFFYPSVGMSAILTEMFKLPEIISYAKIRGSYTIVASSFERFLTNPGMNMIVRHITGLTRPHIRLKT